MTAAAYPPLTATFAEVSAWKRERAREAAHAKMIAKVLSGLSWQQRAMLRRVRVGEPAVEQGLDSVATKGQQVTLHSLRVRSLMAGEALTRLGNEIAEKLG